MNVRSPDPKTIPSPLCCAKVDAGSWSVRNAMSLIDRGLVRKLSLFAKMSDDELDKLVSYATIKRVPPGEAIFEQGDDAVLFYLLLHGRLKVNQITPDGQQIIVRMVHPGIFSALPGLCREAIIRYSDCRGGKHRTGPANRALGLFCRAEPRSCNERDPDNRQTARRSPHAYP